MPTSDAPRRRTVRGRFGDWVRAGTAKPEAGFPGVLQCCWRIVRLFLRNRGPARASALAYTTLLALVPLLAISLSVSALFLPRSETERREQLLTWIEFAVARAAPALGLSDETGQPQRAVVADNIVSFVERIHFKTIGAAATFGLLLVVIGLLRTVETAFNDIWGVPAARPLGLSIVFYWAAITLGPLILLATQIAVYLPWLASAGGGIQNLLPQAVASLLSFAVMPAGMAIAFSALYISMPNTKVPWKSALGGGVTAAALWTLNGQLAALYHTRVLTLNTIYGGLGVLPLFLAGLYLSWIIVLFGAQVAYVIAHPESCRSPMVPGIVPGPDAEVQTAVHLLARIGERFASGGVPITVAELASAQRESAERICPVLNRLMDGELLVPVRGMEMAFTLRRPPESISLGDILRAVRSQAEVHEPDPPGGVSDVAVAFRQIQAAAMQSADSIKLTSLLSPKAMERPDRSHRETPEAGAP